MRPHIGLFVLAACSWLSAAAQEPKTQPKPADKAPAKADKADKSDPAPGRKTKKIEGFTFMISEEALNADASKYERKPLEVLEYECKLLEKMLSPKTVDLLRRLTIFVDWDERVTLSNGRSGTALASYYSHTPQQIVKDGKHPLQAKGVTIHTLKLLTEQRQPKYDSRMSCLLLHEFAHAVHDQLFGYDHAGIKTAYEQAMERRLLEKDSYAATNHREFFAEMSCTYLDRLSYYPHTRDDLKKHDAVTFKTMETIWAGAVGYKGTRDPLPHSEKAALDLKLPTDVKFVTTVSGPEPTPDKLAGKVVLIGYWGGDFTNVLSRLDKYQDELGDYGLLAIGANTLNREPDAIKAAAEKRGTRVTVVKIAFVKQEDGKTLRSQPGGHIMVFDHTGKCVHRGSAYDADGAVRAAVGKLLLNSAFGAEEPPKAFKPVVDAFAAGAAPVAAYQKLAPLLNSSDADTKAQAKKLADLILAPGEKALAGAKTGAKTDPVSSFIAAERVAAQFKNTPLAAKASTLATSLRTDKAVAAELKARALAAQVQQLANKLRGQDGSINPNDERFQTRNRPALDQMKALLEQLRKQYPSSRSTAEAEAAAREFGVP